MGRVATLEPTDMALAIVVTPHGLKGQPARRDMRVLCHDDPAMSCEEDVEAVEHDR
jgi:hypothetical protein